LRAANDAVGAKIMAAMQSIFFTPVRIAARETDKEMRESLLVRSIGNVVARLNSPDIVVQSDTMDTY
jgi:hypothetical protein